jgi:ribosomal-protein-alanine N-acetyltransferase
MDTFPNLQLRAMQLTDLAAILEIEKVTQLSPWNKKTFEDCLKVGYRAWVLLLDEQLIGYGLLSVGAAEAHVLNLCIHPYYQGIGYGSCLLQHLLDIAYQEAVKTVFLEVRMSNQTALHLYLKMGFNQIGIRKDYYLDGQHGKEHGLILAKELL